MINLIKYTQLIVRRSYLRSHPTRSEEKAMKILESLRRDFAFQRIVYPYIVDILVFPNLVLEIDGDIHITHDRYDDKRSYWITKQGFTLYRIHNNDVSTRNISHILSQEGYI